MDTKRSAPEGPYEDSYFPADVASDPQRVGRMDDALYLYLFLWHNITDREAETGEIDLAALGAHLGRPYHTMWVFAQRLEELGEVAFSPPIRLPDEQNPRHTFQILRPERALPRRSLGTFLREEKGKYTV